MTEQSGPAVTIALRDGSELRITSQGLRLGDRLIEIGRLQDARQVAPDPLTIAVRASGERQLIEFQPLQPHEGVIALEAIYRLRPDLRPAGFGMPTPMPGAWPPPPPPMPAGPQPSYPAYGPYGPMPYPPPPPGSYPPPGYGPYGPPPPMAGYPPAQDTSGGKLTPFPRDFGSIMSSVFSLFAAHWRVWVLLGLLVSFIPNALSGLSQVFVYLAFGLDPWGPAGTTRLSAASTEVASVPFAGDITQPLFLVLAGVLVILVILLSPLEVAVIGVAARNAVLGQPVRVGRSISGGLRRYFPVFGTSILTQLIVLLIFLPSLVLILAALASLPGALDGRSDAGATAAGLLGCGGFLLFFASVIFGIYVSIRLVVAPYIAATERLGPFKAIGKSWALTRSQWWHTLLPLLVIGFLSTIIVLTATFVQFFSYAGAAIIAIPLLSALVAPFSVLVAVIILYDLRLRQEGYQATSRQEGEPQPAPTIQG